MNSGRRPLSSASQESAAGCRSWRSPASRWASSWASSAGSGPSSRETSAPGRRGGAISERARSSSKIGGGCAPCSQILERAQAVDVGPVEIVDGEDDRAPPRQRPEQPLQGAKRGAPCVGGVRGRGAVHREASAVAGAPQHREDARQRGGAGREQPLQRGCVEPVEVAGEGVDRAVERLERDELALVAAARECQHGAAPATPARPRTRRAGRSCRSPTRRERGPWSRRRGWSRGAPSAARRARGSAPRSGCRGACRGSLAGRPACGRRDVWPLLEPGQDLAPVRASLWLALEQIAAEAFEVWGKVRHQRGGGRGRLGQLAGDDPLGRAVEGQHAGERLVEHHADAVPVGGRARWPPLRLLRRHVPDRPRARQQHVVAGCARHRPDRSRGGRPARPPSTSTLDGLTSRWTSRRRAARRARARAAGARRAGGSAPGRPRGRARRTSVPRTRSMVKNQRSSSTNSSSRRTRLGWWRSCSARNSFLKASSRSGRASRSSLSARSAPRWPSRTS